MFHAKEARAHYEATQLEKKVQIQIEAQKILSEIETGIKEACVNTNEIEWFVNRIYHETLHRLLVADGYDVDCYSSGKKDEADTIYIKW